MLNYCPCTRSNTHWLWLLNISKRSGPFIEDNNDLRWTVIHIWKQVSMDMRHESLILVHQSNGLTAYDCSYCDILNGIILTFSSSHVRRQGLFSRGDFHLLYEVKLMLYELRGEQNSWYHIQACQIDLIWRLSCAPSLAFFKQNSKKIHKQYFVKYSLKWLYWTRIKSAEFQREIIKYKLREKYPVHFHFK